MSKFVINKYSLDKKSLSALFTFLIWLLFGFLICFVGINNIFAASYNVDNFTAQIYDNVNGILTPKDTSKEEGIYYSVDVGYTANSSGGAWGISSPIPLLANHTYSMTVDPYVVGCGTIKLSTYNRIGVGTSLANAVSSYQNNSYVTEKFSNNVTNGQQYLQFVFTPTINATYIVFPYATSNTCSVVTSQLSSVTIEDLGEGSISQDQINTSLNNQTNEINSSIQESTNTITGEIDDMEQNIIDSNKETQDVIKDQFNSCRPSYNLINFNDNTRISNGITSVFENNLINVSGTPTQVYSNITPNTNYVISKGTYTFSTSNELSFDLTLRLTLSDGTRTDYTIESGNTSVTFTINSDSTIYLFFISKLSTSKTYNESFKIQLQEGSVSTKWEEPGEEICTNRLDEQNETSKGIWQTIKELPSMFLDMMLGLFIPDDLSFIDEFKDVISNKLGFIASIPIQIIDFTLGLVNVAFEEITTISFPSIEIFGVHFWNAEEIDITILLEKLKPFKYFTDFTCVILCCRTLYKFYNTFTGGEAN